MSVHEETKSFFDNLIDSLKRENEILSSMKDFTVFTYLCLKYYFFPSDEYDVSDILGYIVDGSNDCSIDGICNSQTDENEIVFIQTKYRTTFDFTDAKGEVEEIKDSSKKLRLQKYSAFNEKVLDAYRMCENETTSKNYQIIYFSSAVPNSKIKSKVVDNICSDNVQVIFGDEIKAYIEGARDKTGKVSSGEIEIDKANNVLTFNDSAIVNISAKSLKRLYYTYQRGLLGLNLRYYIKNKTVDSGLKETITKHPDSFWYLNNGLVIVADEFRADGKVVKLKGFSVVNGGQTTAMIYKQDFDEDFYLPCKIVSSNDFKNEYLSSEKIAESSNSQKPIKAKDLVVNKQEHRTIKGILKQEGFQYLIKNGETIDKQYKDRLHHSSIDQYGKLMMVTLLQMPHTRTNAKDLYDDPVIYNKVFQKCNPKLFPQILKLHYFYMDYSRTDMGVNDKVLARNARTFVLALIVYMSYFAQKNIFHDLEAIFEDKNGINNITKDLMELDTIFVNRVDNEKEKLYELFSELNDDVIYTVYERQPSDLKTDQSNFLKSEKNYHSCLLQLNAYLKRTGKRGYKEYIDLFFKPIQE